LGTLDPRRREVLRRCFLLEERQCDVAKALGVSDTRVNQLRNEGLRLLRARLV
jgi:DNA-directed RNA polymerase specialized sigma subunit